MRGVIAKGIQSEALPMELVEQLQKCIRYTGIVRGNRETPPPPKPKNVGEIWYYLLVVYTFGEEAEIFETVSEELFKKVNFP